MRYCYCNRNNNCGKTAGPSGCTFTTAFGSGAINSNGSITTISTCSFAGEYSIVTGAVTGQTLQFTSSVSTDWITVHSGTFNGPIIAFGQTPLTFVNTFTGTIFPHWSTNNACGTQSACRTTTVQCTNCTSTGCTFTTAFGSGAIDPLGTVTTISSCSWAGEYATVTGAVAGQTIQFTSSVPTDWITVHTGTSGGPGYCFWANTFDLYQYIYGYHFSTLEHQ